MDPERIRKALDDLVAEQDPTLKAIKLASLCSAAFRERGIELVVVGGSAIEFLTEGAYTSGDIDFCLTSATSIPLRQRQEIMGKLGASGGPRNWQVAGLFVDLLGPVESYARTQFRKIESTSGPVLVMKPEDLLVERVLVSVYPQPDENARKCARILAGVALRGDIEMDWQEVERIAKLPDYQVLPDCIRLINEAASELKTKSPYDLQR